MLFANTFLHVGEVIAVCKDSYVVYACGFVCKDSYVVYACGLDWVGKKRMIHSINAMLHHFAISMCCVCHDVILENDVASNLRLIIIFLVNVT